MKFTFSNLPATGWALPAGRIADLAALAEGVGFDRFAIADLPFHYDVVSVMTACLLRTKRLQVETAARSSASAVASRARRACTSRRGRTSDRILRARCARR